MKLLIWYCSSFAYIPSIKTLEDADPVDGSKRWQNAVVAFIHAEEDDQEDVQNVEKKVLKNLKWAAGKNETKTVVLHSFAHLSDSKARPDFTKALFNSLQERMETAGYEVGQTPFGWFLDLDMQAPGHSLARVFKAF
jgi:hypothetical protein